MTMCKLCACDCVDMYRKHVSCVHVSVLVHVYLVLWVWHHTSNLQGSSLEISGVMAFVALHQPWFGRTLMLQVHVWKWVMFLQKRGNLCAWLHGDCVIFPHDTCGYWTPLAGGDHDSHQGGWHSRASRGSSGPKLLLSLEDRLGCLHPHPSHQALLGLGRRMLTPRSVCPWAGEMGG